MKKYEGMFIVDTEVASKKWDEVDATIRDVVKKHEGETIDLAMWEERKLAYPIRKRRKGTYVLGHFQVPPENLNNIRDEFKITEMILRQIFVIDDGKRKFLEEDETEDVRKPYRKTTGSVKKDDARTGGVKDDEAGEGEKNDDAQADAVENGEEVETSEESVDEKAEEKAAE